MDSKKMHLRKTTYLCQDGSHLPVIVQAVYIEESDSIYAVILDLTKIKEYEN